MSADSLSTILKLYPGSDHFLAIPLLLPWSKLPSSLTWPKWHLGFHSWLRTFHTQSSTQHPEHLVKTWIRLYSSRLGNLQWLPLSLSQNLNLTEAPRLPDLTFYYSPLHSLSSSHTGPRLFLTLSGTLLPQDSCTWSYLESPSLVYSHILRLCSNAPVREVPSDHPSLYCTPTSISPPLSTFHQFWFSQ